MSEVWIENEEAEAEQSSLSMKSVNGDSIKRFDALSGKAAKAWEQKSIELRLSAAAQPVDLFFPTSIVSCRCTS